MFHIEVSAVTFHGVSSCVCDEIDVSKIHKMMIFNQRKILKEKIYERKIHHVSVELDVRCRRYRFYVLQKFMEKLRISSLGISRGKLS